MEEFQGTSSFLCHFGPLPDEISERVHKADPNTIGMWADRVLDAKSLEEVFSG